MVVVWSSGYFFVGFPLPEMVESYHRSPSEWRKEASRTAPSPAGQVQQEATSQKHRPTGQMTADLQKNRFPSGQKNPCLEVQDTT